MKSIIATLCLIASVLFASNVFAQKKSDEWGKRHSNDELNISNRGIRITSRDSTGKPLDSLTAEDRHRFTITTPIVDLGVNLLMDNTNYSDPAVIAFLRVPDNNRNQSLFDLRTGKSINVNIYPFMVKFKALKTRGQRIYISSGLGLQLYNFRYEEQITYTRNPSGIIMDTISFKKNKLALNYLNVPLMFTFKTRLHKDTWLVYGAGVTEGLRLASWTKQVSGERGKVKVRDAFGLADFNTCLSAEFGLEGIVRFYATYQVTSLYQNGLEQHPLSIGLRFGGI